MRMLSHSAVSNSLRPHGLWLTRVFCSWDYLSKNTGRGCYFLFQGIFLTQGRNLCKYGSCIAGWFFTVEPPGKPPWAIQQVLIIYLFYTQYSVYMSIPIAQFMAGWIGYCLDRGLFLMSLFHSFALPFSWCCYFTLSFALPFAPVSPSHTLHLAPSPVAHRGCLSVGPARPGGEKKWHFLLVWLSLYLRQALCSWTGPGVGGHHSQWSWPIPTASLACMLSHFSCVQLCVTLWTLAHQVPLSMGLSRQEYWSGLPFPSPWDLPNPGIEPVSIMSLVLAGRFFTTSASWEDHSIRKSLMACVLPSTLPTGVYSFLSSALPQPESVFTCALGRIHCPPPRTQAFVLRRGERRGGLVPFLSRGCLLLQACTTKRDFIQPPALTLIFLMSAWWRPTEKSWQVGTNSHVSSAPEVLYPYTSSYSAFRNLFKNNF